jgi:histidinol dehydrogenase
VRVLDWDQLDAGARREALVRPAQASQPQVHAQVRELIERVRRDGDDALRQLTERFDGVRLESLAVSSQELRAARSALGRDALEALERAIANVEHFHRAQLPQAIDLETMRGVRCARVVRPIRAVGLYVPAGSAPLPSTAVMLAVPAALAGCPQRVLCTPPGRSGAADSAVLVAAQLCGIEQIFKVGGAQAIAALAYGTQSVPKVDKIFGPGNAGVAAAKQLVAADPDGAALDLPAGPSEVLVIADDSARAELVAADLLAQAEHDPLAQVLLVTPSRALAGAVEAAITEQLAQAQRREVIEKSLAASRCIIVRDVHAALDVSNDYAPEHLILQVSEAREYLECVENAGSVFLGPWSPESIGDYCSGTNHVLPTYGYARAHSGLSVLDFLKRITVQELSADGLRVLGSTAVTLARLEGLDAHARAVELRLRLLADEAP